MRRRDVDVASIDVRICRLACEVDAAVSALEAMFLSDGEAELLGAPVLHLALGVARLEQLIHEAEQLDQRPRRERLRTAA